MKSPTAGLQRSWVIMRPGLAGSLLLFLALPIWAQNVAVNPGAGSYPTLADAFTAINAGTHTGVVTVSITGDTTEPAAGAILNGSGSGAAAYTSITITPSGTRTISGAATAGVPMIDFNGADNVTINGLNAGGNSLTIANTTVSATSGTSTIRFIGGATNNVITNSNIQGSGTMPVTTNGAVIFFATDALTANGNDNNTISNNNIGPAGANLPTKGILCNGSVTTTAIGNSGNTVTNNNIFDYFGAAVTSSGVAANGGCNTWTITNNRFYQTATRTWTTGANHRAIDIGSTTATSGAQGFTITGNIIGYASPTQTGTYTLTGSTGKFQGIVFNGITAGALNTISNNTVANVSMTGVTSSGTSTSSPFTGILVINGPATTNNNTVGSGSANGSLVFSTNTTTGTDLYGIFNFSVDNWTANDNVVGGFNVTNAGASGAFIFYGMRANTGNTLTWAAQGNAIGGSVTNAIAMSAPSTAAQVIGMQTANAISTLRFNTIRNLTASGGTGTGTGASVIGMSFASTTPNHTLEGNTISALTNINASAATVVTGISYTAGTGANLVHRNLIQRLTAASPTAVINGIEIRGGTTVYRNNIVILGDDASGMAINGINEFLGTNTVFNNSVLIRGSGVGGTANTFAFNGQQVVNTRSFQNNNFFNARSNGAGTGKHYGIRVGGSTPNPTGLTSNYNNVFVSGAGGVFGLFNGLDVADLANWQAATGQDADSISANPAYVSSSDLRLTAGSPSRNVGLVIPSVSNDFDGKSRPGANALYDIGADEFDGIAPVANDIAATAFIDPTNPGIKPAGVPFTPQASFTNLGTLAQSAIPVRYRILNASNVEVYNATANIPSLASLAAATASFSAATLSAGTYTTIAIAELGTDTVPANNTVTGALQVLAPLSGTYTVGSSGDFLSLTNGGGVFDAINNLGINGSARFNILGNLNGETGAVVLNPIAGGASVSIRPANSVVATVTGSINGCLIRLNGADNVTIDGSNTDGGTTRDLSFVNTNTGTANTGICISSLGAGLGAVNNTLRNLNVTGADPLTSLLGISVGGAATGTPGADNNGTRIENVSVRRSIFGIFVSGDATSLTTGTVIANNDLTGTGTERVRRVGIVVFNDNGTSIVGNRIGGIDTNESADAIGIGLGLQDVSNTATLVGGGVINALVARNQIAGIVSTSATGFSAAGIAVAGGTGINTIANNMITGVISPATAPDAVAGIFVAGSATSSTRVVFNSVLMSGDRGSVAAQTPSFGIATVGTAGASLELRNNIVVNNQISAGGTNALSFAVGTGATSFATLTASNNIYLTSGAQAAGFRTGGLTAAAGGTVINHANLAAWQTAIGGDAASQFIDPQFISTTDLHIQPSSPASNAGVPVAGITDDFDGQTRSPTTPEIGADELPIGNLTITPNSVAFGNQTVGSTSAAQTVTLGNNGTASLQITALTASTAPFARSGGTCSAVPITIAAGSSCTLTYTFAPTATGAVNQALTVTADAPGSGTIALSGTGVQGNLTITPNSLAFGNQNVGSTSAAQTVTLGNNGTASLQVTALTAAAAPFARSGGTCSAAPITIAAGSSCTLTYTFAPTATGAVNPTLTVTANAPGSGTIALSGTGVQGNLTITPNSLAFGNQNVGSTSAAQTVTLGNNGTASLQVTALTAAIAPFARSGGTCSTVPITITAGSSCTLTYTFAPTATGAANQVLTVTANTPGSGSIALSGTGVQGNLTITPNSLAFGNQNVGSTSAAQTVTLGNNGTGSLQVTALTAATAPFARSGGTCSTVPITITAGSSCTLTYTFAPTATGAANQTLTVTANAPGSGSIALSGNGTPAADLSILKSSNTGSLNLGLMQYTLVVGNAGPSAVTGATVTDNFVATLSNVAWTCTGSGGGACNASGAGNINQLVDLPVGASVVFSITATVALPLPVSIGNTATVAPPLGTTDPSTSNNSASVLDVILLFSDGFEGSGNSPAGITAIPLPATRIGEFDSIDLDAIAMGTAARSPVPVDIAVFAIVGNTVVVQARRIGPALQMRLLVRTGDAWVVDDWSTVDVSRALRFDWSTGAFVRHDAVELVARLHH
jgi:hypothetical protein